MTSDEQPPDDERRLLHRDNRTCPECLNPHTVVVDQQYRGLMRFCPMCDYSWVVGQPSKDLPPERESSH